MLIIYLRHYITLYLIHSITIYFFSISYRSRDKISHSTVCRIFRLICRWHVINCGNFHISYICLNSVEYELPFWQQTTWSFSPWKRQPATILQSIYYSVLCWCKISHVNLSRLYQSRKILNGITLAKMQKKELHGRIPGLTFEFI